MILYLEFGFIRSIYYSFEKKLNFEYYISIYYIVFLEGIFGMLITLIYTFISSFIFQTNYNININEILTIEGIISILLFCILTCFCNLCRLKISEKKKPSFNIITLCFFFINKNNIDLNWIYIYFIFLLIGNLIFCEIISLNFCQLDKYTNKITHQRGLIDIFQTISNQEELSLNSEI